MLVLPADHLIENNKAFSKDVLLAAKQAQKQGILTLGIKPSYPKQVMVIFVSKKINPLKKY